jgi:hypothetical protein
MRRNARCELLDRSFAAPAAAAEKHEPIAHARRVGNLMDREKQRAPRRGVIAQRGADLARLAQIEAVERLVAQQDRMRRQHADGQHRPLALPFRERAQRRSQQRREREAFDHLALPVRAAAEKADGEIERPSHRLRGPGRDRIRQVEKARRPRARRRRFSVDRDGSSVVGQHAGNALEQRRLAGAVGADEAEDLAGPKRQRHIRERGQAAVRLRQPVHGHGRRHGNYECTGVGRPTTMRRRSAGAPRPPPLRGDGARPQTSPQQPAARRRRRPPPRRSNGRTAGPSRRCPGTTSRRRRR